MRSVKGRFPFRLGCTSYVYPADILPNAEKLAAFVDDIELVLFESGSESNVPDTAIIRELAKIGRSSDLSYTVHFPIDVKAGSSDTSESRRFLDRALDIIAATEPLQPFGYILHLEGIHPDASKDERTRWEKQCDLVCSGIAKQLGAQSFRVCIENLSYPHAWHECFLSRYEFNRCLDIGHLWLYGEPWRNTVEAMLSTTRVIHFHGVCEGKDHLSLNKGNTADISSLLDMLRKNKYNRCVTLEVFGQEDTEQSLETFNRLWHQ